MNFKLINVPNIISIFRIIIIVLAAYQLVIYDNINAFVFYVIAMISDFVDGFFARKLNQITEIGKILDPVADKLMIGSAVIILLIQGRMPIWYVSVVLLRDILILFGGIYIRSKVHFVLPSIFIGKVAAVILMITFGLNIINVPFIDYFYYLSAILCIVSFVTYVIRAKQVICK